MEKKYLFLGAGLFVAFIVGMFYLAHVDQTTPTGSDARFNDYAEDLGLDMEQFSADIISSDVESRIDRSIADGDGRSVTSTPTFFANGTQTRFTASLEENQRVIDNLIAQADGETQPLPEDAPSKGATEPVVIIEKFSDFQCPACQRMAAPMAELVAANPETVAFVYRHFPLPMHAHARSAAKAAEAAGNQGKFWEMHDLIFEKQSEWRR